MEVLEGKPASNSGLKKGDVIVAINETEITDSAHLKYMLYKFEIGDTITIKYIRDGKTKEAKVTLNIGLD